MTTHPTPQTVDLDDMPGIPPLVRNARVGGDMRAWIDRRLELHEFSPGVDGRRSWYGVIEGVPVRVDCEVAA